MKRLCQRCNPQEFEVPEYNLEQKKLLQKLKKANDFGELQQKISSFHSIRPIDAKFVLMHINRDYGKCNRCRVDNLAGEYVVCPKCKALNFNWETKNI